MPFDDILLNPQKKAAIQQKGADKLPLNPTAQGWSGQQVRAALAAATTGNVDSILSELESKLGLIKGHFESYTGNVVVLSALPEDVSGYEGMFIFIIDQNIITEVYFVKDNVANKARFFPTNVTVSQDEPPAPLPGDLWFDI
jgi:hypothetical protein